MQDERTKGYDHELAVTRAPSPDPLEDAQGAILQAQVLSVAWELAGDGHDIEPSYGVRSAESIVVVRGEIDHLLALKDTVEDRYGHELPDLEETKDRVEAGIDGCVVEASAFRDPGNNGGLKNEVIGELEEWASEAGDISHEIEKSGGNGEESSAYASRAERIGELIGRVRAAGVVEYSRQPPTRAAAKNGTDGVGADKGGGR